jgi:two-component system chemotaxis sensor kinase CheA
MASKYLEIFSREAEEHLAALQKGLLLLEKQPANTVLVHELLRNAHTLKGSARMVGLEQISSIAHRMEDLLKEMEDGCKPVDSVNIDLLLQGTDAISRMTPALVRGEVSPVDVEQFVTSFDRGEITQIAAKEPDAREAESLGDTVRARVKTLDGLVNLIGEMIINKKRFEDRVSSLKQLALDAGEGKTAAGLKDFRSALEEDVLYLDYLIQELHGKALSLRMLPLNTITDGFQRMIRDLSKSQGKEVKLEIIGAAIEVDRLLLESLKPMFLHMLTNAVDHGIESPEERIVQGKPAKGIIRITARHEGNCVRIDIRDDGRGMAPEKIKKAALAKGVISKEEAGMLRDEDALYLTLRAGFSTSEVVTDLSGRGVGMDVVKKNIEKMKGNIMLKSEVGHYSEISLQLPLTLSVIEALMISCGDEQYAVPISYVQETIKIRSEDITTVGGNEVITIRNATTPLISLSRLLSLPESRAGFEAGKIPALVLKLRDQRLACTIDANQGNTEIVVKGLGEQFRHVRYVFGATILGDGSPALILNVPDIFAAAEDGGMSGLRRVFEESQEIKKRGRILVVDDSITTRTMEQSILLAHGYEVEIAVSGEDALEKAVYSRFELVITDVEMPGINGFELTKSLRAMDEYREVPVIIVSSLSRDQDKRMAIEAGAQAYIVKGAFDQGTLLDTVETLIG